MAEPDNIRSFSVESNCQAGATSVRVLCPPADAQRDEPIRTLFLLPVEPGEGTVWGDPLTEILELDLHTKHRLRCVVPTFTSAPWYADHPTDRQSRQETYFVRDVLPVVDGLFGPHRAVDRLLLGFSKSGWGAFSLLLRHPELFAFAAAWDAPLGMASFHRYGAESSFGTQQNFESYRVWTALQNCAPRFEQRERFALFGYGAFRGHMQATHYQMLKWKIPHHYVDGPSRDHHWNSGWLPEVVEYAASHAMHAE